MGACDRQSGVCKCRPGFGGAACDQIFCKAGLNPNGQILPCFGNGVCTPLREIAALQDFSDYNSTSNYNEWDADMLYGCKCDPGYTGVDCKQHMCPSGPDPLTQGLDEVKIMDCSCASCSGGLTFTFEGASSFLVPHTATAKILQYRLEQLATIEKVEINLLRGSSMCSSAGSITSIKFKIPYGNVPILIASPSSGFVGSVKIHEPNSTSSEIEAGHTPVPSSKEIKVCSGRGTCNYQTGICSCFTGFRSGDGMGDIGDKGDCGYQYNNPNTTASACPVVNTEKCNGHGACDESTGKCTCDDGFTGGGCSEKICPSSFTLFGNKYKPNGTHISQCAGAGDCNTATGVCFNCLGGGTTSVFGGSSCGILTCPSSGGMECGGNGQCMSLRKLAAYAYNDQKELAKLKYDSQWDADIVHGCSCFRSKSVDNQYYDDYFVPNDGTSISTGAQAVSTDSTVISLSSNYDRSRFYRGKYAFAATDWIGYACGNARCPNGENPMTKFALNEIQRFRCNSTVGKFQLFFRENVTELIDYSATVEEFKAKIEEILTISKVNVTIANRNATVDESDQICSALDERYVDVEFLHQFGDLPLLRIVSSSLTYAKITESQKGNKEDIECSGQGICNEKTGICRCMEGFGSSDGSVHTQGELGDCTFWDKTYTANFVKQKTK
jgi:hypothetical protein